MGGGNGSKLISCYESGKKNYSFFATNARISTVIF